MLDCHEEHLKLAWKVIKLCKVKLGHVKLSCLLFTRQRLNFAHSVLNTLVWPSCTYGKKWFCYGNRIRDNKIFFLAATKNFAAATKRFVDRTKHFVVVTKYFCYPYFNKLFCWHNKTFHTVKQRMYSIEAKDFSLWEIAPIVSQNMTIVGIIYGRNWSITAFFLWSRVHLSSSCSSHFLIMSIVRASMGVRTHDGAANSWNTIRIFHTNIGPKRQGTCPYWVSISVTKNPRMCTCLQYAAINLMM